MGEQRPDRNVAKKIFMSKEDRSRTWVESSAGLDRGKMFRQPSPDARYYRYPYDKEPEVALSGSATK